MYSDMLLYLFIMYKFGFSHWLWQDHFGIGITYCSRQRSRHSSWKACPQKPANMLSEARYRSEQIVQITLL